ncbi:MAG: DUF4398 domain-containing protein [Candidatus Poribacteria bacterium]
MMRISYKLAVIFLIGIIFSFSFIIFSGCGVSVSLESARNRVEDAKMAVQDAKDANVESYSPKNMKAAERFLSEAEQALSTNHRQRAYILANKSKKAIESAEADAKQEKTVSEEAVTQPEISAQTFPGATRQPNVFPSDIIVPKGAEQLEITKKSLPDTTNIYLKGDFQTLDMQNRIQAAAQALDAAQKAVESARLLLSKLQVDVELSRMDANIKLLQDSNAPVEMINLIKTWYNQSQQSALLGNYEVSIKLFQRIQAYIQVLTTSIQ